ncbi:hypothetical protein ACC810_39170, partial [Rhizobium ruizarguesonis]
GSWAEITLPVVVMAVCTLATWFFITGTTTGRQLYAFGDNPECARRFGINIGAMQFIAFGWLLGRHCHRRPEALGDAL